MKRSHLALLCAAGLAGCGLIAPGLAAAQDAPADAVPRPDVVTADWSLDFEHSTPTTIAIENADGSVDWYWYFTYKVTNHGDTPVFFDPRITVQTDAGGIVTANLGVDARVFPAVRNLLRNPLLVSPIEVAGKMLPGEDYARESIAAWKVAEDDVDAFKVFVGGIYGETKPLLDPETGEPIMVPVIDALTGEPKTDADGSPLMQPLTVRRNLMMHYKTPGTTATSQSPTIELAEEKDVMR